jgi:hypothetical protein
MKNNNKKPTFPLENEPLFLQLTIHLMNLRSYGLTNEMIASFIVATQPNLLKNIIDTSVIQKAKAS